MSQTSTGLGKDEKRSRAVKASKVIAPIEARYDRIMRMTEVTARSGVSRWVILQAAKRGELELLKLSARAIGIRESSFVRWLDSRKAA